MADLASRERNAAIIELNETIRQLDRYLQSANPVTRIIKQKIEKIEQKSDVFKGSHYNYCRVAKVELSDENQVKIFNDQLDLAEDASDRALLVIDDREQADAATDQAAQQVNSTAQQESLRTLKIAQMKSILWSDKVFATDLVSNIKRIVDAAEVNESNASQVDSYNERLVEMDEKINNSWTELVSLHTTTDDLEQITEELKITEIRSAIQEARSGSAAFIQQCRPKAASTPSEAGSDSSDGRNSNSSSSNTDSRMLRPQKTNYPTFRGDIRTFARFQKEFEKIVTPFYTDSSQRAYVLKESCLKGDVKKLVENIEDIELIWKRLTEKCGNKMDLVDVVIKEFDETPKLKQNDDAKFIAFVDLLEKGIQDLEAIDARGDLANAYTVKMVESKLSRESYLEWLKSEESLDVPPNTSKFDKLFLYLKNERRCIEKVAQRSTKPATTPGGKKKNDELCNLANTNNNDGSRTPNPCLIHQTTAGKKHFTRKCRSFTGMNDEERVAVLRSTKGCVLCLSIGHIGQPCPLKDSWGPCNINGCDKYHSRHLHNAIGKNLLTASEVSCSVTILKNSVSILSCAGTIAIHCETLLLMQEIPTTYVKTSSFFDNGSTISLVSKSFIIRHNLKGLRVSFNLITVGGTTSTQYSFIHEIPLIDIEGNIHNIHAYQIDEICGEMNNVDLTAAALLFPGLSLEEVKRKGGHVELLIGAKNLSIHPEKLSEVDNLVLYRSIFGTGRILAGSHPTISSSDSFHATAQRVAHSRIQDVRVVCQNGEEGIDFFSSEQFGVKLLPNCENCRKCKRCTEQIHNISRVEQNELRVIENNLELDPQEQCWKTPYPFKEDPALLKNNRSQAIKYMIKVENRVLKSDTIAQQFREQFEDYVKRGVFRKLTDEEMNAWNGPVFYVTYHEVMKEGSSSTPMRLVMNSSLKYKGRSLNDILMKGCNTLNDLFGVQLRFRCYPIPIVCDLRKMYHSIKTTKQETHVRRIVYRDLNKDNDIETYGIDTVNFGDRSAAAIASVALRKTAEIHCDIDPEPSEKIIDDNYVDDIVSGTETQEEYERITSNMTVIMSKGGFHHKGFTTAGDVAEETITLLGSGDCERVLGVKWDPKRDIFLIEVRINVTPKNTPSNLTIEQILSIISINRRILTSIVNSCYDPYGLLSALTVQLKIPLRNLHSKELGFGWDDALPDSIKQQWVGTLMRLKEAENITFKRCIKPVDAIGNPILIICSDGSEDAMCATAHMRWNCEDGHVVCKLWAAKTRVTPLKKMTIPRIETQAAVMGARLGKTLRDNSIWKFDQVIHVVDSECYLAILRKETCALKQWLGNRIAEILNTTTILQWYHTRSKLNIADLGTRSNASHKDIDEDSEWQNGSQWMYLPPEEWPLTQETTAEVPQEELMNNQFSGHVSTTTPVIDYSKYVGKSYQFIINLTARCFKVIQNQSFKHGELTPDDLLKAETHIIQQSSAHHTKPELDKGNLQSLRPEFNKNGVICLNSRALEGLQIHYDAKEFPILTHDDPVSQLWMKKVHWENHTGVTSTVAKSRRKFWIVRARKLAERVKHNCFVCRLLDKSLAQQIMAPLPITRVVMSPTYHNISLDLFGPIEIKDTVKKRTKKKVWGLILNCLVTRALHIDVTADYDTNSVLLTLRRFIALHGRPALIVSDKGSQLLAACKDVKEWALRNQIQWKSVPAEDQHQNGVSEALIKSTKRSLLHTIGENILTISELQTVCFEVATLVNGRPIGIVSGSDPRSPLPITPNHLILGRSTPDVAIGPFSNETNVNRRFKFVQTLVDDWWSHWYKNVLPSLVPSYKWTQKRRNVQIGDVCLIKYAGLKRGSYRLGRVKSTTPGKDNKVRSVTLVYKNEGEKTFREVERPIHGIAVIVPVEEQTSNLNADAPVFQPKID